MTPVTLNLSLANRKTMEENAQLLMGTKAAFQLSNDAAAHIGDVLSTTIDETKADFQGLSDSLSYLAPVAKNAGVSLEQAAARCALRRHRAALCSGFSKRAIKYSLHKRRSDG